MDWKRIGERWLPPVLLFAISFIIYLMTLAPSITWQNEGADGGDLITAAYTLGIAHPPGYPTYVLLGRLFTLLPLGDVAYRLNLMSAFLAAATILAIYLSMAVPGPLSQNVEKQTLLRTIVASSVALALAFSPTFWSQALIAEAYALNAFFVGLIIYLTLRWKRALEEKRKGNGHRGWFYLVLASFVFGLSLGNHISMLLLIPSLLFLLVAGRRWNARLICTLLFSFLVGLSVYFLLPWRADQNPPANWGDPQTLHRFLWVITATPYRPYLFSLPLDYLPGRVAAWTRFLPQQFTWPGLLLGLLGLKWHWQRDRDFAISTALFFVLTTIYAITYNTTDSYIYLIPAYIVFALWIGGGIYLVLETILERRKPTHVSYHSAIVVGSAALLLPLFSLLANYSSLDLSRDRAAFDYGTGVLETVEPGAVILADTDRHIFTLWYFRYVVGKRPDVTIVAKGLLQYPWYRANLQLLDPDLSVPDGLAPFPLLLVTLLSENLPHRPIYLTDPDPYVLATYSYEQRDSLYRILGRKSG